MKHFLPVVFFALGAAAPAALAQQWEVGLAGGGSFYTSETITNPLGNADAKLSPGFVASGWLEKNIGQVLAGELRYDFSTGDLKLSSGGTSASFAAKTNAIHYDFLVHFAPSEAHIRPFISGGAGVKIYSGTGTEQPFQALSDVALLSKTQDVTPMISVGAGIKASIAKSVHLRIEVHDFLTPFPKKVIVPNAGSSVGGWLSDIAVMAGIGFAF